MSNFKSISSFTCKNCDIHCQEGQKKLMAEKKILENENKELKKQLTTLDVEKQSLEQSKNQLMIINTPELDAIKNCELIIQNEALKRVNINLQIMINELKKENKQLRTRMCQLEKDIKDFKVSNENIISLMAKRVFKLAPIGFIIAIENLIAKKYESENLSKEYLFTLKQYFSSFVHNKASNSISPNSEEMKGWLEATLDNHETIVKTYQFNGSKNLTVQLNKSALIEIINLCADESE